MITKLGVWVLCIVAFASRVLAAEWEIRRFDGRDYVTLESLAAHYHFPAPPPLPVPDAAAPPPADAEPVSIHLEAPDSQITLTAGQRAIDINGVKQWLSFPVRVEEGRAFVSRIDLAKIIEPRLRPENIEGMGPVTTVVLDPGHGGHDRGALSRFGFEKDFALDVALRARARIEKLGVKVVLTRATDVFVPLADRPAVANHIDDSIFVSIHFNSTNSNAEARGFEIFSIAPRGAPATNDGSESSLQNLREEPGNVSDGPSSALSGSIYHALLGHLPSVDRGIKHARFAVLRLCERPAVLVECGFVSNAPESALINSAAWREQVAGAIADGVDNYKALAERKLRPKVVADYRRMAAP